MNFKRIIVWSICILRVWHILKWIIRLRACLSYVPIRAVYIYPDTRRYARAHRRSINQGIEIPSGHPPDGGAYGVDE